MLSSTAFATTLKGFPGQSAGPFPSSTILLQFQFRTSYSTDSFLFAAALYQLVGILAHKPSLYYLRLVVACPASGLPGPALLSISQSLLPF